MAIQRRPDAGLVFGCTCPGCGAELEFLDSIRATRCAHCGASLRIVMPQGAAAWVARVTRTESQLRFLIDRYLKEHGLPLTGHDLLMKWVYYPYWKIDASLLKIRNSSVTRIHANEIDPSADVEETQNVRTVSLTPYVNAIAAGAGSADFPDTLGLRAAYLKLFPFAEPYREAAFDVLSVVRPREEAATRIRTGLDRLDSLDSPGSGVNRTELLNPVFSLIHFPYMVAECYSSSAFRLIVDGVTGNVVSCAEQPDQNVSGPEPPTVNTPVQTVIVESLCCATCGTDFESTVSLVYHCASCGRWTLLGNCAGTVTSAHCLPGFTGDSYLPFWAFQIRDLDRKEIMRFFGYQYPPEWLMLPAFEMPNVEAAFRLVRRASGADLISRGLSDEVPSKLPPVTVSYDEAINLADALLTRAAIERQSTLLAAKFMPTAWQLVYLPFHQESYFWVDSLVGAVTVERAAVRV